MNLVLAGVRWTFAALPQHGTAKPIDFYVRGGLGLGVLERTSAMTEDVRDLGLGANLGLGVFVRVVQGCGFALEAIDDLFIDSAGVRHRIGFAGSLQIQFPMFGH
jgi:hypothetical protein